MYPFVLVAGMAALYFMMAAIQRPRPAEILAVVLWAAYAVYEYYVANGTLCDANCNIRVDLLLFLPLLGWATTLALKAEPSRGAVALLYVTCLGLVAWLAPAFGYRAVGVVAGAGALVAAYVGIKSRFAGKQG